MDSLRRSGSSAGTLRALKQLLAATAFVFAAFLAIVVAHAAYPVSSLLVPATLLGIALGYFSIATLVLGVVYTWAKFPTYRMPILFLVILVIATLSAHLYIIGNPGLPDCRDLQKNVNGCIMDEAYYVPTAENMLNGTQCGPTVPNCNMEHPFLSKALMAAGIAAFGDNAFGWRIFNVLLGTFSLPLLFAVALKLSGSKKAAYIATLFMALDVMFFAQSSAALLDVPVVFFGLAAAAAYVYGVKCWKLGSYTLTGVFLGLAGLSKETAVFLAAGIVTFHLIAGEGSLQDRVAGSAEMVAATGLVFIAGLQAYDSLFASAAFPTFVSQLNYILSYGSSLIGGGWTYAHGIQITPLSWITYYYPVVYYGTTVSVCPTVNGVCVGASLSFPGVAYYGVTNMLETWLVFAWIPLVVFEIRRQRVFANRGLDRFGFRAQPTEGEAGDSRLRLFALVWFLWSYVPYVLLYLVGRVTYPFYFLSAIPAVALGGSYFFTRKWTPWWIAAIFLAGTFAVFLVFFPSKAFLPDWLRALIGR